MTDTPAAGGDTGAAAAAAAGAKPWYDGLVPNGADGKPNSEIIGHIQNRYPSDKFDAGKTAIAAIQAHREAEKLIGAPANELVRWPKDATDQAGWSAVGAKLGVPAEAKDYDFSSVKFADGSALDDDFISALAPALKDARVAKDVAPAVVKAVVNFMEKAETADTAANEAALNVERDALKINWGSNLTPNLLIAKNAAAALGVTPDQVAALEKVVGYAKVMEMFRNIGARIGEDKFVANPAPGGSGVMSQDQATATLSERMADSAWAKKLNDGDPTTLREFHNLTQIKAQRAA